jgi:pimeloyl-ACP methyl ester carboxylesterase
MIRSVCRGSIFYKTVGEGFPIVILHAMGTDHRSMMAWLEPIFEKYEDYKRIYVDLPAHGQSSIFNDLKSSDDMVINLLDFIDQTIRQQEFSLIGTSFGAYLAQGILHKRQAQIKGICLVSPTVHMRNRETPEKIAITRDVELLNVLDPDVRKAFETLMIYHDQKHFEHFIKEIQPGRLLADREFLQSNWREQGYFFAEEPFSDVDQVDQPALILTGRQDSISSYKEPFVLLEKFKRAAYVVLDQAGHMLQIEKRELAQALVSKWLDRVNESRQKKKG